MSERRLIQATLVTTLDLQNCIGDDGDLALSEALKTYLTLIALNLWRNSIGDNGALALSAV